MLADLNLVHCYDTAAMSAENRDKTMLNSAKHNLQHNMAFFGLLEDMNTTQLMMEKVMGIRFSKVRTFFWHLCLCNCDSITVNVRLDYRQVFQHDNYRCTATKNTSTGTLRSPTVQLRSWSLLPTSGNARIVRVKSVLNRKLYRMVKKLWDIEIFLSFFDP